VLPLSYARSNALATMGAVLRQGGRAGLLCPRQSREACAAAQRLLLGHPGGARSTSAPNRIPPKYPMIMTMSGHKTISTFKQYNTFAVDDLRRVAAQLEAYEARGGDFWETSRL